MKKSTKYMIATFIFIISTIPILFIFYYNKKENNISINNETIEILGSYGTTLNINNIDTIQMLDKCPSFKWRTNGYGGIDTRKGYFKNSNSDKSLLYIQNNDNPTIMIKLKDGGKISSVYINMNDNSNTMDIYKMLKTTNK